MSSDLFVESFVDVLRVGQCLILANTLGCPLYVLDVEPRCAAHAAVDRHRHKGCRQQDDSSEGT